MTAPILVRNEEEDVVATQEHALDGEEVAGDNACCLSTQELAPVRPRTESELEQADPEVATLVADEIERQSSTICVIPSENYVSRAVLEAMGSLTPTCSRTRARLRTWPCTSPFASRATR